jgi:hypothetical protein
LGGKCLNHQNQRANIVEKRWPELLPSTFKMKWSHSWDKHCSKKEVGFISAIWNKVVVVNMWRAIVDG